MGNKCRYCDSEKLVSIGIINDESNKDNGAEMFKCELCSKNQVIKNGK